MGARAYVAAIARISAIGGVGEDDYESACGAEGVDAVGLHGDICACWGTGAGTDGHLSGN